jgi:hypothetical protein
MDYLEIYLESAIVYQRQKKGTFPLLFGHPGSTTYSLGNSMHIMPVNLAN